MGLINDQCVILQQQSVLLNFGQQNTVGHQLNAGVFAGLVSKTYLVADIVTQRRLHFFGYTGRNCSGSKPPWLSMADKPAIAPAQRQTNFRDLRGFT